MDNGSWCRQRNVRLARVILRPATPSDDERILAWNEADVHFLAPMDQARLAYLRTHAHAVEVIDLDDRPAGFVITFLEGAEYDSPNFAWFSEREPIFHYVDRIVIDPIHRGTGLATQVYAALAARFPTRPIVAEVNVEPPNPASLAFHAAAGFREVGRVAAQTFGLVYLRRPPQEAADGLR